MLRAILFNISFYLNFVIQAVVLCPLLLLPRERIWWIPRNWVRSSLWLHRKICAVDEEYRGLGNRVSGGCLVAAKHQSTWETLALVLVFERPAFVLKRELTWVPLFGWYALKFRMIPIDRRRGTGATTKMAELAQKAASEGRAVIIFPEGTRRPPGAAPAYRFGVAKLYAALDLPCVPVALNSGLFWPRRALHRRPGRIVMEILPAISPGLPAEEFAERLKNEIESATSALLESASDSVETPRHR